jgi:transaldolase
VFKEEFATARFAALQAHGARVQRPLWASTSTKNPDYHDLLYVDNLIGPQTVNTMPLATIDAVRDHGLARSTIEEDLDGAKTVLACLEEAGLHMADVTEQLKREGVKLFADSFDELMQMLEKGTRSLTA